MSAQRGVLPLDLLRRGNYDAFVSLVGPGTGRRSVKPGPLSTREKARRKPLPPHTLADALQDRIHRKSAEGRAARTARNKLRGHR